uniref:Uncharacterized protein n=1 Tax=Rhizophagus irregularis (strain DAOM 181602 / DAOM 197198 / MUCL 43194) TaxID=747089 RepID=U9TJJ7_RHIID
MSMTFLSSSGQDLVELLQEYFIEINTEWLEQHFESDHQKFSVFWRVVTEGSLLEDLCFHIKRDDVLKRGLKLSFLILMPGRLMIQSG